MSLRGLLVWATAASLVVMGAGCRKGSGESAAEFLQRAEQRLLELGIEAQRASWVQSTYITHDTEILAAEANQRFLAAAAELAKEATRFDARRLPEEQARKLKLLRVALSLAAPAEPKLQQELAMLAARMESAYGKAKFCETASQCLDVQQVGRIMAESRKPAELLKVWTGWHDTARPIRGDYQRFVELANRGARELGFADTGAMWKSRYDMEPEAFAAELERLWRQVKPLYVALHTYVRKRLREKYGEDVVPRKGPIPAHLMGNIWAQSWDNLYPLVAPANADPGFDLTALLKRKRTDELAMVRYGEAFFTSLGFAPLPDTFWQRSLFVKPRDREVVCHASAWNIDMVDDLRIKMCIEVTGEDFAVIHHELGHNFYQRAYNQQPPLFRDSANDGFHEAVGDTIALSVTPEYLVKLGLLNQAPGADKDLGLLLMRALEKVAFLPFGLVIDQWRWKVFSGEIPATSYNRMWWQLRREYQGVAPAVERGEEEFDAGAKYHVPANTPYTRYFLAHILQFQFHRALAEAAGCRQPLHRCSIYGNQEAGKRLQAMLAMGQSRPWMEALEALTGKRDMDATAMLDYFAPLSKWLEEQNRGEEAGW